MDSQLPYICLSFFRHDQCWAKCVRTSATCILSTPPLPLLLTTLWIAFSILASSTIVSNSFSCATNLLVFFVRDISFSVVRPLLHYCHIQYYLHRVSLVIVNSIQLYLEYLPFPVHALRWIPCLWLVVGSTKPTQWTFTT